MKKDKIILKMTNSPEAVLCLGPTISALKLRHEGCEIGIHSGAAANEAALLVPGIDFLSTDPGLDAEAMIYDLSSASGESWGNENADWKAYLQGCAEAKHNPYHHIDLLRKGIAADTIDVNFELLLPKVGATDLPDSLFAGESLRVALCAASLGIDYLQATLEGIARLDVPVTVYLLGTVSEKRKSAVLLSAWEERLPLVDLCGRLSLSAWAATLQASDIAFTGPGMSALMASGYGTFTLCLDESRNPLHFPYGHGHLVIQRTDSEEFFPALTQLSQEILRFALDSSGSLPSLEDWQSFADQRIDSFLSRIRFFATQRTEVLLQEGTSYVELYLRPLLFLGAEYEDILQSFHRLLWEHSFQGRSIATHNLEILHQNALNQLSACLAPIEQLYELANFGRTYSVYVRDSLSRGDIAKAQQESRRLDEVDGLIRALADSHDCLQPLAAYHEKRQHLLTAVDPMELAEEMSKQFEDMQSRIMVLLDLAGSLFHTTLQKESTRAEPIFLGDQSDG